jgi:hypothetical protein
MAYQPFVYSSPNIPAINPLGVVGTSYSSPNYTSGSEMIANLSNAMLNRKKEEKNAKAKEIVENKKATEEEKEEPTTQTSKAETKPLEVKGSKTDKTTDKDVEGINLSAENEKVVDDFREGDID